MIFSKQPFGVKFSRPSVSQAGAFASLDPAPKNALDLFADRLQRGFLRQDIEETNDVRQDKLGNRFSLQKIFEFLKLPIYSRKGDESLLNLLANEGEDRITIAQLLGESSEGLVPKLLSVRDLIRDNSHQLGVNFREILSREPITDYLFAYSLFVKRCKDPESIFNYLTDTGGGWKIVYDYVVEKGFWEIADKKLIILPESSVESILRELRDEPVSFTGGGYTGAVESLIRDYVFGANELKLIKSVEPITGPLTDEQVSALIQYIRTSRIRITMDNAEVFLPIALANLTNRDASYVPDDEEGQLAAGDYSVNYYDEEMAVLEYDQSSVEAAAMLFFSMVWGDELGIFEVINRIATQAANNLQLSVRRRQVAEDLSMYVLDEQFLDLRRNRTCRRVSPPERQMFYRQVFGVGNAPVVDGSAVNIEFPRYWAVLMTEVARYIGKVEESSNSGISVSPQKLFQAIEDVQYNLSNYCSGMAKVAAPIIYSEMDFVIQRLLNSDDIKSQLSRRGGQSFWGVVETVRGTQNLGPLRSKGRFGHEIISTIAKGWQPLAHDVEKFSAFISTVEAYILAESQLAGAGEETPWSAKDGEQVGPAFPSAMPGQLPTIEPPKSPSDGWNF